MSTGEADIQDLTNLAGRELGGRYILDKFIDCGGFGAVYLGLDKRFLNAHVAVKVGFSVREFMKEANLAHDVRHDNIVQVTDYGCDNGLAFLVMEFLNGEDLEKLFRRQGCRLTTEQLCKFVTEVGAALAHAHTRNLIHRDLKPRNVFIKGNQTNGSLSQSKFVLVDFGIASKFKTKGTLEKTLENRSKDGAGTIEYMAPELLGPNPLPTVQSDLYAFGVLLYQMMTGRVPFRQTENSWIAMTDCLKQIIQSPPPPMQEIAPDRSYPAMVIELVMQCLKKDPARRPASMTEVCERFLTGMRPLLDLNRGQRTSDPYITTIRPGDIAEAYEQERGWRRSTQPRPLPSRTPWFWIAMTVVLVAVSVIIRFWQPATTPTGSMFHAGHSGPLPENALLTLIAGETLKVTIVISDFPGDVEPTFEFAAPDSIHVDSKAGDVSQTTRVFELSVPDINAEPGIVPFTVRVTVAGQPTIKKSVTLDVCRPAPWLPDVAGFQVPQGARLCQVETSVYSSIMEFQRSLEQQRVLFRLIPGQKIGDVNVETFYIMDGLVTNALFREFAREKPAAIHRDPGEREWDRPENANYPVTGVFALEAQQFAQWLAGEYGSLPTTVQWDLSSGYYEFRRLAEQNLKENPREKPIKFDDMVWKNPILKVQFRLGTGPASCAFQELGGDFQEGRSPYGCQYQPLKSGELPTELTSTLIDQDLAPADLRQLCKQGIPTANESILIENDYFARLRSAKPGAGSVNDMPWLRADPDVNDPARGIKKERDLDAAAGALALNPVDAPGKKSFVGFRVVVLTNIE